MSDIHNLQDYKFAKVVANDLIICIKTLDLSIKALEPFTKYTQIFKTITLLRTQRAQVVFQHNHYKNIYNNKGKKIKI